ncbi:parafibromin [Drosophila serrata]|uniref:parafibromin n=1 Tax=Drosophila serrata TaxID=7274 RepID=UPI000A1CFD9D|nr:parafibromin [Drosophila serrata]
MESLSQTMSVEAIAAIKAKRLAMKRQDKDAIANSKRLLRAEQRQVDEHQVEVCRKAMERERQNVPYEEKLLGEKDLSGVLRTLALVYDIGARRFLPKHSGQPDESPEPEKLPKAPKVSSKKKRYKELSLKYNRYDQEKFLKDQEAFGINPLGSNLKKRKFNKDLGEDHEEVSSKRIAKETDKKSSKRSSKKTSKESSLEATSDERPSCSRRHTTAEKGRRRSSNNKPIIVVPAALTSLINLYNAKQLLQEMRYVSVDQVRKSGVQPTEEVVLERLVQGELVRYRVIDNVKRLKPEEWQHVAAVFAMGPQWQFKGWPHGGDPVAIFHEVCAFHLHFKNTAPSKELRNLKVNMLALPQHERHLDCGIMKEFWEKLDHHIAVRAKQFAFMKQK